MNVRNLALAVVLAGTVVAVGVSSLRVAQAQEGGSWEGRTPWGHPDLQGNWTNGTITPIERQPGMDAVLTPEQVAEIEGGRQECIEANSQVSDPDREAPAEGGVSLGCDPVLDAAAGGTGGYNIFYLERGDRVAIYDGEPRSSLVTHPEDGRIPDRTEAGEARFREMVQARGQWGEYDNPENRPLAERCVVSFGSNAGPPMLPNYFYNNNYTIVQTPDHVMIMTEMVHDARIIPFAESSPTDGAVRRWFGNSVARWEGETLVIETTGLHPDQLASRSWFMGTSDALQITERLTRVSEETINYEFLVEDPETYTSSWGGEVPFNRMDDLLYEYACHEANYALENVLSGARAQERESGSP